jgi:2-C-methyl-D-erythritol 4-phosphate cytidylyltransferase
VIPRIWFVVPAAGASRRLGGPVPKQYQPLAGRCVIEHTLEVLLSHASMAGGVVALSADDTQWPTLPAALRDRVATTVGGRERCHSVLEGLRALSSAGPEDWVLVHDAARPCLGLADLTRLIDTCSGDAVGGLLALPVADTLKLEDGLGRVGKTVPRERLWRAQTPQMFRLGLLTSALDQAIGDGEQPGDEAAAIERLGLRPLLVEGSPLNIKITHPADLAFAAHVLAGRGDSRQ